jgi:fructose-1,6-bisphosphatase/inositol monophosphatase family enzyme
VTIDIEMLSGVLREAARAEVLPRFRKLDKGMVRQKTSAIDLVTEADEASERAIAKALGQLAPEAMVVGEEAVAADARLLDKALEADVAIYVDPIDGTANFAAGLPLFAVMAAVVKGGETIAGVIYDPMGDDFLLAERGGGAWQVFPDGRRMRQDYASPVPLAQMTGTASVAYLPEATRPIVLANLAKVRMFANFRCAGQEYRLAAGGNTHFIAYNKLMPWDHLAGSLICAEAGAYVARLDGSAYLPGHRDGGLLVAPDAESWQTLRREVFTF